MSVTTRVNVGWPALALGAALLVATGAGITYVAVRSFEAPAPQAARADTARNPRPREDASTSAPTPVGGAALPDVLVPITAEAAARAGIAIETVGAGEATTGLQLPGVVEPNAYRQSVVTSLVGGRVTDVLVELGEHVRRGQALARLFSAEVADAHTRYVSMRADLDAHERELARTQKLVEIGAASRQELDRIHAEHTARTAEVQGARSRLELLGVTAAALDAPQGTQAQATADVFSPIDGIVVERLANVGVNIDPAARLFTVVDLSTVWVVADLYEKDFSQVRIGSPATVTTSAYPGLAQQGRVSYIDPQISPQTRTARLRVQVPNPQNQLRFGMYANVEVSGTRASSVPMIPRGSIQTVDDRQVVYLADPGQPGSFTEREVRLGRVMGDRVEVLSGVQIGDTIVAEGSFYVRAERERLGLRAPAAAPPPASATGTTRNPSSAQVQTAKVVVSVNGYEPDRLTLRAGMPARITFLRTTDATCGTEVVFPSLNIKRALPLNEPVVIEFTPTEAGEIAFVCGMNMLHGTVAVQ